MRNQIVMQQSIGGRNLFSLPSHFSHYIPEGKVIVQSTIDPMEVNRDIRVDHAIIGDAKLVLSQLIAEVEKQTKPGVKPRKGPARGD